MAKSRLIAGRSKKSTVLVSVRTLQEAISRANMVVEQLMESDQNDPQIEQIENAVDHMSRILKMDSHQMRQDGVSSISDYMDDAVKPEEARKLKNEVDMILKMHKGQRDQQQVNNVPDSAVIQHGGDQYPSGATESGQYEYDPNMKNNLRPIAEGVHASKKQGNGAGFTTDRDEQGEAKAPENVEIPRIAKKKKEAVPEPAAAAPVSPAPPVPAPAAGGANAIDYIPTETLIKVIGDLPKEDDFAQNKGKQDAVVQLTEILKSRPVLPPEQEGGGAPAPAAPAASTAPALSEPSVPGPVAASARKRADLGDHAVGQGETISNGSGASAQVGQGGASPQQVSTDTGISKSPAPEKADFNLGGLSLASLDEEKTADDYRIQDYKLTEEGVRPSGGKPSMDEQEEHGVPSEVDFPNEEHEVPMSASLKAAAAKFVAEVEKIASAGGNGGWATSYKPMEVDEDGGRTPEIAEAHAGLEDHTGIDHPAVVAPIKLNEQQGKKAGAKVAADLSTGKAVKQSEQLGNDLKKMYLEAKSLTQVNDTRAVREAVEGIFRAANMFDEATKMLNKQHQQEESEAAAAEIREKTKGKKSSINDLALAAAE